MKIDVLGCGSAFSSEQNTSALRVIDAQNRQWLIDCGPTIPRALWRRGGDINEIDVIYFTHVHPDHCTGLTALLNYWKSFSRQKPLIIYSQPQQRPVLMQLAALANWPQTTLCFAIDWRDSAEAWTWHDWHIQTAQTQHELTNRAIRITFGGQTLFYSGDGRPTPDSIALMAGADLVFQECASLTALADDASHGDFPSCLALFQQLNLRTMGLYHCYDAILPALKFACLPWEGLFVSHDGLQYELQHSERPI
ncbi:ribonuclease Z [Klebsiella sp. RHBSTW-00484]|jgi:ribonuclease Z|uniref:MBL fold metallo-hydrolase n=1 Tax=unclassified Klebsiella TaxID=2608929 RepID=UPI0015E4C50B|nr:MULTISPECIES: ribonuclease Z [unclassified Klebsiella]MBA7843896.1 ribonuclease Z [Klebsiella sp. RHBSTW-00465]QLO39274.1 ribonuclease Z [Klebsiella sp. RHBSTW-00484]QLT78796.1 ribonuclease Z [Klebsiella sp. RHBSTW-00464]